MNEPSPESNLDSQKLSEMEGQDMDDFEEAEGARLLSSNAGPLSIQSGRSQMSLNTMKNASLSSASRQTVLPSISWFKAFVLFATLVLIFLVAPAYWPELYHHHAGMTSNRDARLWNGTHEFRRTVLMVSIDGLRFGMIIHYLRHSC